MATLLLLVLLISNGWADTILERNRRGAAPYPKMTHQPDNRCGHQMCPPGHRDFGFGTVPKNGVKHTGRLCGPHVDAYGRGWGYPWKIGDPDFDFYPALNRCIADEPILGCELWGAIAYPYCRWGYANYACCICKPYCTGVYINDYLCVLPCTAE